MRAESQRVLVVGRGEGTRALAADLRGLGLSIERVATGEAALVATRVRPFDVVLTELGLRFMSGSALCEHLSADRPELPVIVMAPHPTIDAAVGAMRAGASDFVEAPTGADVLLRIARATTSIVPALGEPLIRYGALTGGSDAMRALYARLDVIARTDAPVMIRGETGTGKEVVAREIHQLRARPGARFVAVNCAALPEHLLESELFGHARGAFTGAHAAHTGLFVQANGGTLLLDEIGDMSLPLQGKLLRALQERRVRPVGGAIEVPFDARLVCATHRNLEEMVAAGTFREDLFYRIDVIDVEVPPLRTRGLDVLTIAESVIADRSARESRAAPRLSAATKELLLDYSFPGNVRELINAIDHALALGHGPAIEPADLPMRIVRHGPALAPSSPLEPLETISRRYMLHVLDAHGGNVTHAARALGVDRKTLGLKLRRWRETPSA